MSFNGLENLLKKKDGEITDVALQSLSEGVAYIISAASDLLGMNPSTMHFRSLGFFATEVELGVPALLAPFLYLNHRGFDRERILGMRGIVNDPARRWDSLTDLFEQYLTTFGGMPKANDGDWAPLPEDVKGEIREVLRRYDAGRRGPLRVLQDVGAMPVPGIPGRRVQDELQRVALGEGPQVLREMLNPFGLNEQLDGDGRRVSILFPGDEVSPGHRTTFVFSGHDERVDHVFIDEVVAGLRAGENAMIVAVGGATHGAINRGRFLQEPAALIDPALLVELLARVYDSYATEQIDQDPEEDLFGGIFQSAATQVLDVGGARRELRRQFLHNAPVLSRADMENRLAYRGVVVVS